MKITIKQQAVLDTLRQIGRENFYRYRGKEPHLHKIDCENVARGDDHCAFGLGGFTYQVGYRLGMKPASVLAIFKSLESKGLVLRETQYPEYQRPLYWWPVGLAAELVAELGLRCEVRS
ncbi:hypothetical protein [Pseudomonas sp.]|uniref:hypothetical protein n=1 Tax=Pseudomonas sp. TaxID=306 RepID=UPI00258BD9EE|nr:hypothetical protein [Pseudomonas sp.]